MFLVNKKKGTTYQVLSHDQGTGKMALMTDTGMRFESRVRTGIEFLYDVVLRHDPNFNEPERRAVRSVKADYTEGNDADGSTRQSGREGEG